MDSAEFAIRGFFLLVVFLIIKSVVETNFLNKFYFVLSPSVIFPLSLQMQSVERSCRNNHITRRILNLFLGTSPAVCLHITRHFSGSPDSHSHFWLLVAPSDKLSSISMFWCLNCVLGTCCCIQLSAITRTDITSNKFRAGFSHFGILFLLKSKTHFDLLCDVWSAYIYL